MAGAHPTRDEVAAATASAEANMQPQSVPVNVYETPGALVVLAPVPAVTAKDVTVEVRPGTRAVLGPAAQRRPRGVSRARVGVRLLRARDRPPAGFGRAVEATLANGQLAIRVLRGDFTEDLTIQPLAVPTSH